MAIRLQELGCEVHVWCPADHPARKTRAVSHCYRATLLGAQNSLRNAIEAASPDFIIACDDDAVRIMHELHAELAAVGPDADLRRLIARSLGEPSACQRASARAELMHIAEMAGVRVAPTRVIASASAIRQWAADLGFPAVLKINGSWGGMGVVTVHNIDQARTAFQRATHPSWRDAVWALLLRRHTAPIQRMMQQRPPVVTMQKFVQGRAASRSLACWRGEVLAGINALHLKAESPTGPATVIEISDCSEMEHASERLLAALGMSGLCGLDFIIEKGTGTAYLLEMNPRATPTCHLSIDGGRDLARALLARIAAGALPATSQPLPAATIALFPNEWRRDPNSPYLRNALHDIPLQEADLVRDCTGIPWAERGPVARLWARLKRHQRKQRRRIGLPPITLRRSMPRVPSLNSILRKAKRSEAPSRHPPHPGASLD